MLAIALYRKQAPEQEGIGREEEQAWAKLEEENDLEDFLGDKRANR